MLGKLDCYMLNPFCSTNVYGLATLNTPKEKILILGLVRILSFEANRLPHG